jgi:bleomycin hydrolase
MRAIFFILSFFTLLFTQNEYKFTDIYRINTTPVKSQAGTNTCWSFASSSFLETELIRMGNEALDISESFFVRHNFPKKADKYVRRHGRFQFGPGGLAQDVLKVIKEHGFMPEKIYPARYVYKSKQNQFEMDYVLESFVETIVKRKKISTMWKESFTGALEGYLGKLPQIFVYKNKMYTAKSFAKKFNFNPDDYVEFTSFTNYKFYDKIILDIPDNWNANKSYNIPLDEFMELVHYSLKNGFSLVWDGDTSEKTLKYEKGLALLPSKNWKEMSKEEQDSLFIRPVSQQKITQETRQQHFDSYISGDDHLMHLVGLAKDQNGEKYYLVKNSYGNNNSYGGNVYLSESYFKSKTMTVLVHKDAVPKKLRKKLNIK